MPFTGTPFGGTDPVYNGEWYKSVMVTTSSVDASINEDNMVILGDRYNSNANAWGLIENYANSRAIMGEAPDVDTGIDITMYAKDSQEGYSPQSAEVLENMEFMNNNPPYDGDDYLGGQNNGVEPLNFAYAITTAQLGGKLGLNGFLAPNGLIEVRLDADAGVSRFNIQLIVGARVDY